MLKKKKEQQISNQIENEPLMSEEVCAYQMDFKYEHQCPEKVVPIDILKGL
jgi:replication-associated recombination protein RarA